MESPTAPGHSLIVNEDADGVTIVSFSQVRILDAQNEQQLGEELTKLVDGPRRILLNLSEVQFLSSGALAQVINLKRQVADLGGKLRLCGIPPQLYAVFRVTKLDTYFDIREDEEAALDGFE